jgi:hypothetical protein
MRYNVFTLQEAPMTATLGKKLSAYFSPEAPVAKRNQQAYRRFLRVVSAAGLSYNIAKDGFIELSNKQSVPFYGDWNEVADRIESSEWA